MPGGGIGTGQDKIRLFVYGLVSREVQSVLERLQELLGPSLHIISSDGNQINFHVWGNSDPSVFQKLKTNKESLFSSVTARGSKIISQGVDNRGFEFIRIGIDDRGMGFYLPIRENGNEKGIIFRY